MNNRLQIALRSAAVNGVINLPAALSIAEQFDEQEQKSIDLLKVFKQNTGLHFGEIVDEHISTIEGRFFNKKAYDVADRNGEQ